MLYEKILIDQGVEKFWLIKHKIDRYVCSFVNGVRRIEETEDRINELFFIKNNNLYKISFGIIDDDSLFKELIDKSVKNSKFTVKNPLIKLPSIKAPDICKEKIFYFNECKRIIDSELKKVSNPSIQLKFDMYVDNSFLYYERKKVSKTISENNLEILDFERMDYKKYDNLKIKPGFLEKVINSDSQNDNIQNEELFVDACEAKYMRIDSKVFSEVLIILEEAFKGFFVMNNQSFIKKNDFGKAICNEKISIKKVVNNYVFDSEGMECKNKYLIKKGILENCLNNIYTASVLKLEPGDSVYNYELGNHVIGAKKLIMEYDKCSEIVPEADIYIVQIKKDTISFDFDSGYFQAVFIGKEKNKKIRYMMRCNIIDLLNSIVAVIDNNYDTDSYEKDVILDLGKLK